MSKMGFKIKQPREEGGRKKEVREGELERGSEREGGREGEVCVCVCMCVKGNVRLRVKDMVAGGQCHSPCSARAEPRIISKSPAINYSHSAAP